MTDLAHVQRLLVAMALATWIVLMFGARRAWQILFIPPTGKRRTLPWKGKHSLLQHGLELLLFWLGGTSLPGVLWQLTEWSAPNWSTQSVLTLDGPMFLPESYCKYSILKGRFILSAHEGDSQGQPCPGLLTTCWGAGWSNAWPTINVKFIEI